MILNKIKEIENKLNKYEKENNEINKKNSDIQKELDNERQYNNELDEENKK